MIRIKLFGLFIAFALLALVRPRKCLELLEAADRGARRQGPSPQSARAIHDMADRLALWLSASMDQHAATDEMRKHIGDWLEHQKTI